MKQLDDFRDFHRAWEAFEGSLPKASRTEAGKLREIVQELALLDGRVFHPDSDLCTRWIGARMLSLGWTKERFGESDDQIRRYRGESTTEPIAKKYERIAFQELCGHLVSHCSIEQRWRNEGPMYQGPWQISETIDIDPSLLVRGDDPMSETQASRLRDIRQREEGQRAWWRTPADHRLSTDLSDDAWLGVTSDIPRPEVVITATDPEGREWLTLERHQEWSIEDPSDLGRRYRSDKRQLWIRTQANIVRADDKAHPQWAANTNWMGLSKVSTPANMTVGSLGEYPDLGAWPAELDLSDRERRPSGTNDSESADLPAGWELARIDNETTARYALATVGWYQEAGNDFSTTDTPGVLMPSRVLLGLLDAHWSGGLASDDSLGLGTIEREYSWTSGGELVAFCTAERNYGGRRVLWVRAEPLRTALDAADLGMWSWVLGEKIYWSGGEPSSDRADCFAGVQLSPAPTTVWGFTVEREQGRHRGSGGTRSRILTERADGIATIAMAHRPRPKKAASRARAQGLERSLDVSASLDLFDDDVFGDL